MKIFTEDHLKNIPELYDQDGKGNKAVVYLVVSFNSNVWLITEYSEDENLFFGFVCLSDIQNAELGYISKIELEELSDKYPLKVEKVELSLKDAKCHFILSDDILELKGKIAGLDIEIDCEKTRNSEESDAKIIEHLIEKGQLENELESLTESAQ